VKPILYIAGFWGAVLAGVYLFTSSDAQPPPGVLAASDPQQVDIVERHWTRGEARFTALAAFGAYARVLSTNHYLFDGAADLSPVDLALGWGPMSDSRVLAHLHISQGGRFYHWRSLSRDPLPITRADISSHSANMHMIPASDDVKKTLLDIRKGELVRLAGYLVRVDKPNGWRWQTSLSRTDTGAGACEIVWVDWIKRMSAAAQTASR
jgi:hypothetical protein